MKKHVIRNFDFIFRANLRFYSTITGIVLLGIAAFLGFSIAKWQDKVQLAEATKVKQNLLVKEKDLFSVEQKLNFTRVELEVGKLSLKQLQQDLRELQQTNTRLKEQLSFYQNVMAPELTADGVMIDTLQIEPTVIENQFRYRVVLVQTSKQKKFAKGYIELTVNGSRSNRNAALNLTDLKSTENDYTFSFRYFQILEGEFVLDPDFTPERVHLTVTLPKRSGQSYSHTEKEFDWQPEVIHRD